ncbi:MAG: T9SS type A sorting domain-containing protein [Sphingobacteriales bacterium]|nr:MAG: T9SS type A sorting domain-containing protein [Sphingobacteriales bacterium]
MYKNMALAGLLQLLYVMASAQTSPPMGIPNLSIPSLTVSSLAIPSLETINPLAVCNCPSGCGVLPVKLLEFEGMRQSTVLVKLDWKTTNEYNNKGFIVERSLGNTDHFDSITFVAAKLQGGYENKYNLPDNNDFSGISYYRLQQVDLDGRSTFSEIVAVKGYGKEASLALYPNPVSTKLTAEVFTPVKTTAVLLLTDATQKLLYTVNVELLKGINFINIPAAHLGGGLYFIRVVTDQDKTITGKFIKL